MSVDVAFSELAAMEVGATYRDDAVIRAISTDSRRISAGDTYLAIVGERYDGHDFIDAAVRAGAAAVVASREARTTVPVLRVTDTVHALAGIARLYRRSLPAKVIGITGSSGKTTVKGMTQSVCVRHGRTTATVANNNNIIGVAQTLLSASPDDNTVVVEMGTSASGELRRLVDMARPDIGVMTNVSESHLAGLGERDAVFTEKSAIVSAAAADAVIVVNRDDDYAADTMALAAGRAVITYGFTTAADVHARKVSAGAVEAQTPHGRLSYRLNVPGRHNVSNSLATIAIAQAAGIRREAIVAGLEGYTGAAGRLQLRRLPRDITLLDDSYNANPASTHAALEVLGGFAGRKLFAYAGMAELGPKTEQLHRGVGDKANAVGVDRLYIYGEHALATYQAFAGEKRLFAELDALAEALAGELARGDTVLVKGSRRYHMERVAQYLPKYLQAEGG